MDEDDIIEVKPLDDEVEELEEVMSGLPDLRKAVVKTDVVKALELYLKYWSIPYESEAGPEVVEYLLVCDENEASYIESKVGGKWTYEHPSLS